MDRWQALPPGARAALDEQWAGVVAGGLPCGAAIDDGDRVVARGRNHAYDQAGPLESRMRYPLQYTRLAHAELNALACLPTYADHGTLTLWSTQHPCAMCAAAVAFTGIGEVRYVADDPSDHASTEHIAASRAGVTYRALDDPWWWIASNLLFLYTAARADGERARNLVENDERYPALVHLALDLARDDAFGEPVRAGVTLSEALAPHGQAIEEAARSLRASPG